jgi:hypothetical protein
MRGFAAVVVWRLHQRLKARNTLAAKTCSKLTTI